MKTNEISLDTGKYYHIYNRGNNRENLFYNKGNYEYFLRRYDHFLSKFIDTLAYCLLPNHFHLLVRIREVPVQMKSLPEKRDDRGSAIAIPSVLGYNWLKQKGII